MLAAIPAPPRPPKTVADLRTVNTAIEAFLARATERANAWYRIAANWRDPANALRRILLTQRDREARNLQAHRFPAPETMAERALKRGDAILHTAQALAERARQLDTGRRRYALTSAAHHHAPTLHAEHLAPVIAAEPLIWPTLHEPITAGAHLGDWLAMWDRTNQRKAA